MMKKKNFPSVIWADLKFFVSETWLYFFGAFVGIVLRECSVNTFEAVYSWFVGLVFLLAGWPLSTALVRWAKGLRARGFSGYVMTVSRNGIKQRFVLFLPDWVDNLPLQQQIDFFHSQIKGQI